MGGAKASCANPFTSLYEISAKSIGGAPVSMSEYRGKVLIIVNVASE
jgi:glutathione peroxidase-family protein